MAMGTLDHSNWAQCNEESFNSINTSEKAAFCIIPEVCDQFSVGSSTSIMAEGVKSRHTQRPVDDLSVALERRIRCACVVVLQVCKKFVCFHCADACQTLYSACVVQHLPALKPPLLFDLASAKAEMPKLHFCEETLCDLGLCNWVVYVDVPVVLETEGTKLYWCGS